MQLLLMQINPGDQLVINGRWQWVAGVVGLPGTMRAAKHEDFRMALKIYGIAASRALRPLWMASELGLTYEHVKTDYRAGESRTDSFLALNPNGHVPVIVDERAEGAVTVWESMACALYLARHHGRADGVNVVPATVDEDAAALRWAFWVVNEVESDALTVLAHRRTMPEDRRKPELADRSAGRLLAPLRVLEQHLSAQAARGQDYLAAARFTVADLCAASVLMWLRAARSVPEECPKVQAWLEACLARPAYRAVRG
jgi:glutathione S-transferase